MTPDQRAARLRHHMYETCEGIREQSERIVALEELVADMWAFVSLGNPCRDCDEWVQLSQKVGTCRLGNCKHTRDFASRIKELEVPL